MSELLLAPELQTTAWLNSKEPVSLERLKGKVVLLKAFQMLCPGCVSHALPQAVRVQQIFNPEDVAVIGLHTVFEHHKAQGTRDALEAFLHEYRIGFPVGIDESSETAHTPKTMQSYQMQGTPTTILIDRDGYLRKQAFGQVDDMALGAEIMSLLRDSDFKDQDQTSRKEGGVCTDDGCSI